jgi:hypothetical protein
MAPAYANELRITVAQGGIGIALVPRCWRGRKQPPEPWGYRANNARRWKDAETDSRSLCRA